LAQNETQLRGIGGTDSCGSVFPTVDISCRAVLQRAGSSADSGGAQEKVPKPSSAAGASSSVRMDEGLREALVALGLPDDVLDTVHALGVEALDDLNFVEESDFTGAGMSVVQARKVMEIVRRISASGHTMSAQDSSVGYDPMQISPRSGRRARTQLAGSKEVGPGPPTGGESTITTTSSNESNHKETVSSVLDPTRQSARARALSRERRLRSEYWRTQSRGRPQRLIFVRHGESEGNVNRAITQSVPDHCLHLTANGRKQALAAGQRLREIVGDESVTFIVSPYTRALETMNGIFRAFKDKNEEPPWREDVRIREQEHGNFDSPEITDLHRQKQIFGPFYYRFPEGESQADCYDRASSFYESLYRSWVDNKYQNQVIVCHGMMILVMLMRLMRLPIHHYERLEPLSYCEFIVMERPPNDAKFQIAYTWEHDSEKDYRGLRVKPQDQWAEPPEIWNGNPDAPVLHSKPLVNTTP